MDDLSPKVQNQIAQFQQLQQQLQAVLNQKFQMDAQVKEMARTTEELNKSPEDVVIYKSIGALLIKVDSKETILKDIEESKETMEVRLKSLSARRSHFGTGIRPCRTSSTRPVNTLRSASEPM